MTDFNLKPSYVFGVLLCSILLSLLLHLPNISTGIQGVHTWRQSQTAWNIRNFVRHDANILNPRTSHFNTPTKTNIYRYEFPIMQWSIAMIQKVVGEHVEVIRLFIFLLGAITVIGFFNLLKAIDLDDLTALIGAVLFQFSPVFYYYTINPIPDNLALMGSVWYLYFILTYFKTEKVKNVVWASISLLIATWAKLPFLMFSIISIVYFLRQIFQQKKLDKSLILFIIIQFVILIPAFAWYAWVMPTWKNGVMKGIFSNKVPWEQTKEVLLYHLNTMFPKLLLNYAVVIPFFIGFLSFRQHRTWWLWSIIGITLLYLVLEFNMISYVHDYYMIPFLPWLYIVVAFGIQRIMKWTSQVKYFIILALVITSTFITYHDTTPFWSVEKGYFNTDLYKYKQELVDAVPGDARCIILNDHSYYVFSYAIDKMGYIFRYDQLQPEWINDLIRNKNAEYLYSDSRNIDENIKCLDYFDKLVLEAGSIRVFKLKTPQQLDEEKE